MNKLNELNELRKKQKELLNAKCLDLAKINEVNKQIFAIKEEARKQKEKEKEKERDQKFINKIWEVLEK